MDNNQLSFIKSLYSEIGKHLISTDEKRDNLLGLYLMMIILLGSAIIAMLSDSKIINSNISIFIITLLGTFLVIGEVLIFSNIGARKWHAEYVNCLIIIQHIVFFNEITNIVQKIPTEKREKFNGSFHTSRSFLLVQIALLIIWVILGIFLSNLLTIGYWSYLIVLNLSVLLFIVNRHMAITILRSAEKNFWDNPFLSWCLAGLKD